MRSNSSVSGKKSLAEKFERYFGKSASIKLAICLGLIIIFLAASLLFALFMNVFTPGSVADAGSLITNASPAPLIPSTNAGMIEVNQSAVNGTDTTMNGTKADHLEDTEAGDMSRRPYLSYIYNFTILRPSVTPAPVPTPTPTVAPKLPLEVLWDRTFYESVKPIQNYDRKKLLVDDTSYRFDAGPLLIDPSGYGGSVFAYPGDTIGIRLHIYNNGKPLSTVAMVNITLLKIVDTKNIVFKSTGVDLHYDMDVDAKEASGMEKSILINIPEDSSDSAGYYQLNVKIYVNGTLSSDMSKEFNVL